VVQLTIASAIELTRTQTGSSELATDFVAARDELSPNTQVVLTLVNIRPAMVPEQRNLRKQPSQARSAGRPPPASRRHNDVTAALEQRALTRKSSNKARVIARQHGQCCRQPVGAFSDSFQMVV
jgi:hypothetical protein